MACHRLGSGASSAALAPRPRSKFGLEPTPVDAPVHGETHFLAPPRGPSDKEIDEGGGDSMLARYFREMATHPVMGPEEELETAVEVERAEVMMTIDSSYCAAADHALDSLEKDLPTAEEEKLDLPVYSRASQTPQTLQEATPEADARPGEEISHVVRILGESDPPRGQRPALDRARQEVVRRLGEEPGEEEQDSVLDQEEGAEPSPSKPHLPATTSYPAFELLKEALCDGNEHSSERTILWQNK